VKPQSRNPKPEFRPTTWLFSFGHSNFRLLSAFDILFGLFRVGYVSDVTRIFDSVQQGDPKAAEELLPLVYEELRKLAVDRIANEKPGHTLQPTAPVHEAWLKIAGDAISTSPIVGISSRPPPEIAAGLDRAPRTVDRHWAFARAWLKHAIRASPSGPPSLA